MQNVNQLHFIPIHGCPDLNVLEYNINVTQMQFQFPKLNLRELCHTKKSFFLRKSMHMSTKKMCTVEKKSFNTFSIFQEH